MGDDPGYRHPDEDDEERQLDSLGGGVLGEDRLSIDDPGYRHPDEDDEERQLDSLGGGVLGEDRSWRKKLKKKLKNVAKKVAPIAGQLASTALKASGVPGAAQ